MLAAKKGLLRVLLIALGIPALLSVACARAAEPTATPRPAATAVATPTRTPAPTPATVRPTEWTVVLAEDTAEGDPFTEYGTNAQYYIQSHVMEVLVWLRDPQGGQNVEARPLLAESWNFADDKTVVFNLRKGVKFHNGEELTAEHVKFSYESILAPEPAIRKKATVTPLGEAVVVDKYTVKWNMPKTYAVALDALRNIHVAALVRKGMTGAEFGKKPIGTGPYKAVQWERDKPVIMESFDGYWSGKKAFPPKLVFRYVPEPSTRVAEVLAGRAQIAQTVPLGELSRLEKDPKAEVVTIKSSQRLLYNINLYAKDPPLRDPRVRLALNYSIDRQAIAQGVLEGHGSPSPAGFLLPGELGYISDFKPYPYDPAKAKTLLKESGIPDGFGFNWIITQGVYQKDFEIAEAAANQMAKSGIRATLTPLERARLLKTRNEGDYHVLELTWPWSWERNTLIRFSLIVGLPQKILEAKWGAIPPELAQVYDLLDRIESSLDTNKRKDLYTEANKIATEKAIFLNIHTVDDVWGVQRDTGWRPPGLGTFGGDTYYDYWALIGQKAPK